jgi:hypothetical protein
MGGNRYKLHRLSLAIFFPPIADILFRNTAGTGKPSKGFQRGKPPFPKAIEPIGPLGIYRKRDTLLHTKILGDTFDLHSSSPALSFPCFRILNSTKSLDLGSSPSPNILQDSPRSKARSPKLLNLKDSMQNRKHNIAHKRRMCYAGRQMYTIFIGGDLCCRLFR